MKKIIRNAEAMTMYSRNFHDETASVLLVKEARVFPFQPAHSRPNSNKKVQTKNSAS